MWPLTYPVSHQLKIRFQANCSEFWNSKGRIWDNGCSREDRAIPRPREPCPLSSDLNLYFTGLLVHSFNLHLLGPSECW